MKKIIYNLSIVLVSSIAIVILILKEKGLTFFVDQLSNLKLFWIFGSIFLMFLYWIFESLALSVTTSFLNKKISFKESITITMVEQLFNSITPFSSGGQPAQIIYMSKNGFNIGKASSIILLKFIVYQSVFTVYCLIVVLRYYHYFCSKISILFTITFLGLTIHISLILITLFFSFNKKTAKKSMEFIFFILKKASFFKIKEDRISDFENSLDKFYDNIMLLKNNPKLLLKISVLVFFQLTSYFLIPYFICNSLGEYHLNVFIFFAASVFVATIISIVPLPGSVGGAESGFYLFFEPLLDKSIVIIAILVWRFITYYSCLILGSLVVIMSSSKKHPSFRE